MWEDLSLKAIKIICSVRQDLNLWHKSIKLDLSKYLCQWASATNFCSKIGTTGRSTRISWVSTRTRSSARRIIYEGKGSPRYSKTKNSWIGWDEESSRTTNRRILCTKIERKTWDNTKAYFINEGYARTEKFHEWFRINSRSGIKLQSEIVIRFQSTCNDSKFSFHAEPRQTRTSSTTRRLSTKDKVLRNTQIRSMHEMREIKRAQEQRIGDISVQKLRENHETNQQPTSQLQLMQDHSFPVSPWWFRVLVLCSAATKDCRLTHGFNLDYRKTFFEINFLRLIHPDIILKEFNLTAWKETEKQFLKQKGRRLNSRKWRQTKSRHNSNADICDKTVDYEFHNTGGLTAERHGRTAKTANIGIAIRQIPWFTFIFILENSIQKSSDYLFWFSIGSNVVDQGGGDGWFIERNWSPRDPFLERNFPILRSWTRRLPLLWARSSRIPN